MKTCSNCKEVKEPENFSKCSRAPDGLQYFCKACNKKDKIKFAEENPGFYKIKGDDGLTNQQRWNAKNPEKVRAYQLKDKYGITPEDFDRILTEQGGACAICRDTDKKWCVDHCHRTGKVRSILCYCCNIAIGNLGDSARLAIAAAEYLTKHDAL